MNELRASGLLSRRSGPAVVAGALLAAASYGCSEQPITVPVRSLEQSGDVAFMCMQWDDKQNPGRPMQDCASDVGSLEDDSGRLFALVTQTTRGEVALIDVTNEDVVDLNGTKPGFNFLPTGGNPVDIVATPGGTAAFVGSAEANREGIWVLPAKTIVEGSSRLTSFAACALPAAPGNMMMIVQPLAQGEPYRRCSGEAYDSDHPNGDLSLETEDPGVRKLLVSLPELGGLAVIDAQEVLDQPAGSFRACRVERWIPLPVDLPPTLPQQRTPEGEIPPGYAADGSVCEFTEPVSVETASEYVPRPAGMALDTDTGKLYVADEQAPVIHVLDLDPICEASVLEPLVPMSASRPERVVVTRDVAVSPTTTQGKKYLYATDLFEGSLMVFDVSLDSTDRTPLLRPDASENPFQARDRLAFSVPVRQVEFVLRDRPEPDPVTGATAVGVSCNPADDGSVGALYRTSSDFSDGAGPGTLRGIFAIAALTNGQIAIVDVEDFDAPCRRPKEAGECESEAFSSYEGATGELSCNVVVPHHARSSYFIHPADDANGRVPGLQSYPVLTLDTDVLPTDQTEEGLRHPKLLAPTPEEGQILQVGGRTVEEIQTDPAEAEKNMVLFDMREPRVHTEQDWLVVFEGIIPGFGGHVGRLDPEADERGWTRFYDGGAFFCDRGVHDYEAAKEVAESRFGLSGDEAETWAREHTDVLHITEDFLQEEDPYWDSVADRCSWLQCRETFGLVRDPKSPRDLPIMEAYQGTLVVDRVFDFVRCCFPTLVSYQVRPGNQWVVRGGSSGFLHHVEPDPDTGRCVDSCDPNRALLDGRAYERDTSEPIPRFDGPDVFRNPSIQFVVWRGQAESERDMTFSFREKDGFIPLLINLAAATTYIQPQSLDIAPTGELVLADGSAQGLIFVDLGSLGISRNFF